MKDKPYYRIMKKMVVVTVMIMLMLVLGACNSKEGGEVTSGGANQSTSGKKQSNDDFDEYIRQALRNVSQSQNTPEAVPEDTGKVIHVNTEDESDTPVYVSASDDNSTAPEDFFNTEMPEDSGNDIMTVSDGSEGEQAGAQEPLTDGSSTPDDFEVGTSCIYIKGEVDSGYSADLIKALNKARAELGYPELTERAGLDKCADRRTREIMCSLSHIRPNGQSFNSLAPSYFMAEMLAIDKGSAEETVDAWIKDPVSRQLVFTTKYTSVGSTGFKCNGLYGSVIAFGY